MKEKYPWWRTDSYGWPIERITNRPAWRFYLRCAVQQFRKFTHL